MTDPSPMAGRTTTTSAGGLSRRRFHGLALGTMTAGAVAGAVVPPLRSHADTTNLLPNPSFDQVSGTLPTSWTAVSGTIASVTDPVHTAGGRAVRLTDTSSTGGVMLRSTKVTAHAGRLYEATVWVVPQTGAGHLYLEFWNAAGTRIGVKFVTARTNAWQQLKVALLAPEGTATATVLCYQDGANTGVAVFDDASLAESTGGAVESFPLLTPGHPRLFFTAADVPVLQARAASTEPLLSGGTGAALWTSIKQQAEQYLAETSFTVNYVGGVTITYQLPPVMPPPHDPPPGYTGAYPYWTAMGSGIRARLEAMSLAWVITEDVRFANRIVEYLVALASWPTWSDPAFNVRAYLDTAHLLTGIAFAYDVVHGRLTPEQRASIGAAIDANGLRECWALNLTPADHNIAMLQVAALGSGAAVVHGENDQSNKYLTLVKRNFAWYLEQRRTTGDQEGFLYTSFAMDNILSSGDQIARVTGVEGLLSDPYVSEANAAGGPNLVHWMLAGLVPGGASLAPISDSAATRYFPVTSAILARRPGGEHSAWYVKQGSSTDSLTNRFLYGSPDVAVTPPTDLPLQGVVPAAGWAHSRSGWTASDSLFLMVGNNSNVGHNHYDQNSILIGTNNRWIMSDPGYRDYIPGAGNVFTVRDGHTGITVDGKTQDRLGGSVMSTGVQSDGNSYFSSDATAAYAGLGMSKVIRRVVALPDQYFYVVDQLEAPAAHSYGWRMFNGSGCSYDVDGRALAIGGSASGSRITVRTSQAHLVATFAGGAHTFGLADYAGATKYGPLTTVTRGGAATTGSFATVLQVAPYQVPGHTQAESVLASATHSPVDARVLEIDGASLVFLRSVEQGQFITFPFTVSAAGSHRIRVWLGMSPAYASVQVSIDGTPIGGLQDCYNTVAGLTPPLDLGVRDLAAGQHTITFTAAGKNAASSNWFLSVDAWQVIPDGTPADPAGITPVEVTELGSGNGRGARIVRDGITDLIGLRWSGSGLLDLGGVRSDGDQFLVSRRADGAIERIGLSRGTMLTAGRQTLVQAGAPVDAGAWIRPDGTGSLQVRAERATTLRFHHQPPVPVEKDGQRVRARVDARNQTIEVDVPAGGSTFAW